MSPEPAILLSAGEASGDLHGATLCRALRELHPGVRLVGMGGPRMAAAGMELVADVSGHAVVGTSEALGRIPRRATPVRGWHGRGVVGEAAR